MPVADAAILQVEGLKTRFQLKRGTLTAVDHVSFSIARGETFGLVGIPSSEKVSGAQRR